MRDLIFRAFDKRIQVMTKLFTLSTAYIYTENHFEVMQSTGLKDKNGKLIFEGDIVMYSNDYPSSSYPDPDPGEPHNDFAVVEWSEEGRWNLNANFKSNREKSADWIHEYGDELEVIGNRWEDRENLMEDFNESKS